MKNYILTFFIISFLSLFGKADDPFFYHIGLQNGLSQINIMSIYQDEFGTMWFGTTEGLNRYNGKDIQIFRPSQDGEGLTQNIIYNIQGNKKGSIYLVADTDLVRYNLQTQKFECLLAGKVRSIFYKDEQLWIATDNQILLYEENSGKFSQFVELNKNTENPNVISISQNNMIWIGTSKGLICISKDNPQKQEYLLKNRNIRCIFEDRKQDIWAGTLENGIYIIKPDGETINYTHQSENNSLSNNQIRTIIEDYDGKIWIGTFLGLNQYDPITNQWKKYINSDNVSHTLSHSSIFSLYQDIQGTIWVGTYFGGVNYFNNEFNIFKYYGASSVNTNYLSFPFVSKMTEDNHNNLWICTEGGALNSLNLNTRQFSRYMFNSNKPKSVELNNLKCIWYRKNKNSLYIGMHNGGLAVFDLKTKKTKYILHDPLKQYSLPNNTINKMQYYDATLIVLTQKGIFRMNLDKEVFYPFSNNTIIGDALKDTKTHTFFIDSKDRLWMQKDVGKLLQINLQTNQVVYYTHNKIKDNTIGYFDISDIFENKKGEIYFSTIGSGIFKYNEISDDFENYSKEKDGLLSDYCYAISESTSGKLIILYNKGFSFFDPNNPKEIFFQSSANFPLIGFNIGSSIFTTETGEIFIGGINGLVSFHEEDLNKKNKNYSIYFDKLLINNKIISPNDKSGILDKALPLVSEIILKAKQNNIAIEFASSNYLQSTVRSYEYKLEGFDSDWVKTESKIIAYTNLNPGMYRLHIREKSFLERNNDNKIYTLAIKINPPFYLTKIAYLIYFLLIGALIAIIARSYSWRTKLKTTLEFERKEKERIEELNNIKLRFFTNISHEFRTPLTLISTQTETLLSHSELSPKSLNKITKVRKNATHLQNLITELLDFNKQEQGFKNLIIEQTDLISYIKEIYDSFYEYAKNSQIKLRYEYTESPLYIYIDTVQLQKAIYNLLSNAFKFTSPGGEINIKIRSNRQQVTIQIIDNGAGMPTDSLSKIFDRFYQLEYKSSQLTLGTGIGLALTKEIITAHKGTISVESSLHKGSTFSIILQLGSSHFSTEELEYNDINQAKHTIRDIETISESNMEKDTLLEKEKTNKPSVLLVEDNEELLELLKESFSTQYNVYTALDGETALEIVMNEQPEIVVSDIMIPKLTGKEMCYRIKNNINTSHIPVVLLTAQASDKEILDGFIFGADAYITKPFNMKILISNCTNILNNRKLIKLRDQTESIEVYNTTNESDSILIDKATQIIKDNFNNSNFDMNQLSIDLGMGRSKLYIKIKEITGLTPNEFTLNIKLKESVYLLKNKSDMNISDIAYNVGFSSSKYFSKCFRTFYGITPQEWRKTNKEGADI